MSRTLVVAAVVALAAPAAADPKLARNADEWCERESGGIGLTFGKGGIAFRTDQASDANRQDYRVVWRGRLDSDRRQDVILDEGGCGTQECLHGGYVQCRDGTYASVFSQYAARVRVKPQRTGWAIVELEHVGEADSRGRRDRFWDPNRFGAKGYDE